MSTGEEEKGAQEVVWVCPECREHMEERRENRRDHPEVPYWKSPLTLIR
jgi:hypothetical protein